MFLILTMILLVAAVVILYVAYAIIRIALHLLFNLVCLILDRP
jgi:hypothetical protein